MKKLYTLLFALVAVAMTATAGAPRKMNQRTVDLMAAEGEEPQPPVFVDLGEGLMTETVVTEWYQYAPVTYKVKIQKAESAEVYRVIAPYGQAFADAMKEVNGVTLSDEKYDKNGEYVLELDATDPENVYFPKTYIGCNWGSGPMYIGIPTIGTVVFRDGAFTAGPRNVAVGDDTGAVALNMSGKFRIVLPGVEPSDFELTIAPDSHCLTDGNFSGTLTVGNDIAKVYYGILNDFQEDEMLSAYGEVMTRKYEFKQRGKFAYAINPDYRKETLVMVGVDVAGNEVAYAWTTYYDVTANDDQWTIIGTGMFTDPFLPALTNCKSETLETELQIHKEIPGYLRMVNPYAKSSYATDKYFHGGNPDHNHYIYINGQDPDCIYIEESPICFDFGFGLCRVCSAVDYFLKAGFDIEECKELEMGGVVTDGVLTFPTEETLNFSMLKHDNGDWYYTDPEKGDFALTLPNGYDFSAVSNITVDNAGTDATVTYYNLQGQPVDNPAHGTIVIRRQGTQVSKTMVR